MKIYKWTNPALLINIVWYWLRKTLRYDIEIIKTYVDLTLRVVNVPPYQNIADEFDEKFRDFLYIKHMFLNSQMLISQTKVFKRGNSENIMISNNLKQYFFLYIHHVIKWGPGIGLACFKSNGWHIVNIISFFSKIKQNEDITPYTIRYQLQSFF